MVSVQVGFSIVYHTTGLRWFAICSPLFATVVLQMLNKKTDVEQKLGTESSDTALHRGPVCRASHKGQDVSAPRCTTTNRPRYRRPERENQLSCALQAMIRDLPA